MVISAGHVAAETASLPMQALEAIRDADGQRPVVHFDRRWGTPSFIKAERLNPPPSSGRALRADRKRDAVTFLEKQRALFKIRDPRQELLLESEGTDSYGQRHLTYQQIHNGLKVWGKKIKMHYDDAGNLRLLNGRLIPSQETYAGTPVIDQNQALQAAASDLQLDNLNSSAVKAHERIYWPSESGIQLAYRFTIQPALDSRWIYIIDAMDGAILAKQSGIYSQTANASGVGLHQVPHSFRAWLENGNYYLVDAQIPVADPPDNNPLVIKPVGNTYIYAANASGSPVFVTNTSLDTGWDPTAVSAIKNTETVYEYYKTVHQRDSLDGKNMSLSVLVHYNDKFLNAFWNGSMMVFGDKDDRSTAGCLDVAAHEMSHGVIEHSANLVYAYQSGALNESFADVFAMLIDGDDWTVGEDCFANPLRDFADPQRFNQPSNMSQYLSLPADVDQGGVHINSGIPNHAAYLTAQAIGREQTGRIYYLALTEYLTPTAQFIDARRALLEAAGVIYGEGSSQQNAVAAAWDQVEITEQNPGIPSEEPPLDANDPVNGDDVVIYLSARDGEVNGPGEDYDLWVQNTGAPPFGGYDGDALTQLNGSVAVQYARPSALTNDSGQTQCFFVGRNGSFNSIFFVTEGGTPIVINQQGENGAPVSVTSLAISQDGRVFASATDEVPRNLIRVTQLVGSGGGGGPTTKKYPITSQNYNENGEGINTLLYAENLAFDFSGDFIVFEGVHCVDAPNNPCGIDGGGGRFRSVGILNLVDESVHYLFPNQNPNIDYRNPSFAANNNFILSMDRIDRSGLQTAADIIVFNRQSNKITDAMPLSASHIDSQLWGSASFWGEDDYISYLDVNGNASSIARVAVDKTAWILNGETRESVNTKTNIALPVMFRTGIRRFRRVDVQPNFVNFGEIAVGNSAEQVISLRNRGNEIIPINLINNGNSQYNFAFISADGGKSQPTALPPFSELRLRLRFRPTQNGTIADTLTVHVGADPAFLNVSLLGTGSGGSRSSKFKSTNGGLGGVALWSLLLLWVLWRIRSIRYCK